MNSNNRAFTFLELLVTLSMLMIVTPIVYWFLIEFSQKNYLLKINSDRLSNTAIINNMVSGLIKNSYGIDYSNIDLSGNLDKLVLYIDKLEKNTISIYVKQDLNKDISRVYINRNWIETPIHTTSLFIENFEVNVSPKPVWSLIDVQPWVSIEWKTRTRSPLKEPTEDEYYDMYNKSEGRLYWRWVIRNYVPSSLKN